MFDYEEFYRESKIPELTMSGITNFIHRGAMPGGFLTSVLENNLKQTYGSADENNIVAIPSIVQYLYNNAPGICWGSPREVREWMEIGGMDGYAKGVRPKSQQEGDDQQDLPHRKPRDLEVSGKLAARTSAEHEFSAVRHQLSVYSPSRIFDNRPVGKSGCTSFSGRPRCPNTFSAAR